MVSCASVDRCAAGIVQAACILQTRSEQQQGLPEHLLEKEIPLDIFMVELFLRRVAAGITSMKDDPPTGKLSRKNKLARQACASVIAARDLLMGVGEEESASELVEAYHELSELDFGAETKLNVSKLQRWIHFEYHEWEHSPAK